MNAELNKYANDKNIGPAAIMFRDALTPRQVNTIITHPGAYDILVTSNGDPNLVDMDQIGFTYGTLHVDAAFDPKSCVYEFYAFRNGYAGETLGSIPVADRGNLHKYPFTFVDALALQAIFGRNPITVPRRIDRAVARELVLNAISRIYTEVVEEGLSDMSLPEFATRILNESNGETFPVNTGFSLN